MRRVAVLVLAVAIAIIVAGWWFFGRDDGEDLAAFFTLATPTICESGAPSITASNGHFAAFTDGRELAQVGDKFLVVDVSARNDGSTGVAVSEESFVLAEPGDDRRRPAALKEGAAPLSSTLKPGDTTGGILAFSVPASTGAAKLVYDDGCTHQDWLVP